MRKFTTSIDISAPTDRVWEVMSDVERWHEWTPSITSIKRLGSGPLGVGSKAIVRQPKLPPALWKVSAIEPGRNFVWRSGGPGIRVTGSHTVQPVGTGSRATLFVTYEGMFGGIFARMTQEVTQRYIEYEARGLKARSENPGYHHSGFI
jgi:carbon monoxide dehydrogenase subunit G